ncbi:MAG: hypothetical protein ACO1NP_07640 [Flavobacterium sp.]
MDLRLFSILLDFNRLLLQAVPEADDEFNLFLFSLLILGIVANHLQ